MFARAAVTAVSAKRSNGCRKVATTLPSSQVQFDSRKLRSRRKLLLEDKRTICGHRKSVAHDPQRTIIW